MAFHRAHEIKRKSDYILRVEFYYGVAHICETSSVVAAQFSSESEVFSLDTNSAMRTSMLGTLNERSESYTNGLDSFFNMALLICTRGPSRKPRAVSYSIFS